jgi:hypothetical protein
LTWIAKRHAPGRLLGLRVGRIPPREKPVVEVACEIGRIPRSDIANEAPAEVIKPKDDAQPADRRNRVGPADLVEPVERAKNPRRRCRRHCRQESAIEHREPNLTGRNADQGADKWQQRERNKHAPDSAHRVERKREAGGRLEILVLAVEHPAAVPDDQLP